MNKNCLVISTYFGPRRERKGHEFSYNLEDCLKWMKNTIEYIKNIDSGVPMDIIISNHDCHPDYDPENKSKDFLFSIDKSKIKNGIIKVLNREYGDGSGGSFKSFNYAFKKFKDEYDYWFFAEDDVRINAPMYFRHAMHQLDQNENVAFVCCSGRDFGGELAVPPQPIHCHNGAGCTHVKYLKKIFKKMGELPYSKIGTNGSKDDLSFHSKFYTAFEQDGELAFTNCYLQLGLEIELLNLDKYYPDNNFKRGGLISCHDFE